MQAIIDNILLKSVILDSNSDIAYAEVLSVGEQIVYVKPGDKIYFSIVRAEKINKFPESFLVIKEDAVLAIDK